MKKVVMPVLIVVVLAISGLVAATQIHRTTIEQVAAEWSAQKAAAELGDSYGLSYCFSDPNCDRIIARADKNPELKAALF